MSGHGHDNHVKRRRSRRTHRASGRPYTSPDAGVPSAFNSFKLKMIMGAVLVGIVLPIMSIKHGDPRIGWSVLGVEAAILLWVLGSLWLTKRRQRLAAEERAQRRRER